MTNLDPKSLSFSQAFGYEQLPQQLKPEEISDEARTGIWNILYEAAEPGLPAYSRSGHWHDLMRLVHSDFFGLPLDEFRHGMNTLSELVRPYILAQRFNKVYDLLLFMVRELSKMIHGRVFGERLSEDLADAFVHYRLAYTLDTTFPPTIYPTSTPEEGAVLVNGIQQLKDAGLVGAREHLQNAAARINDNDWAGAVRESIHAVESVACVIAPEAKTLGTALRVLEDKGLIDHPALREGFSRIYGYTNDEQGIRHALLDQQTANVGQDEALFMFGACASFASYLSRKQLAIRG